MKKKYYTFIFLLTIAVVKLYPQVYTPNGSLVPDTYVNPEQLTSYDISYISSRVASEFPQATLISDATTTYNCHAYAWHMTEGGSAVWMGLSSNPTSIYWTDGSYYQTTSTNNGLKVSYSDDNHSAITTEEEGVFVSKWGYWPLMRHRKDYCPYASSNLMYFRKAIASTISGLSHICPSSTTTFTINYPPVNYTWGHSSNITPVSGSPGTFTTPLSGGNAWVSINVNGVEVSRHNFIIGSDIDGPTEIAYAQTTTRYTPEPLCSDQVEMWTLDWQGRHVMIEKPDTVYGYQSFGRNYVDIVSTSSPGFMTIYDLTLIQENGTTALKRISVSGIKLRLVGANRPKPIDPFSSIELLLYPNPASDILTVELKTYKVENNNITLFSRTSSTSVEPYTIQLWSEQQGLVRTIESSTESVQQISLQGLPTGMYFVLLIKNGETLNIQILCKK